MARGIRTTLILSFLGLLVGTLGTWSVPLGHGYSAFWPALVVQVAGGIWFGAWGAIAAVLFPILTNLVAQVGVVGIFGFVPANFAQGFIPAWAFRHFHMDPAIPGRKGICFFFFWGALIPAFAGAVLGSSAVVLFGAAEWASYPALVLKWGLPHVLVSMLIGIPTLRVLTPLWRDMRCLVSDWWGVKDESGEHSGFQRFRDTPMQFKLVLALCGLGLSPLLIISLVQLVRGGTAASNASLVPLFLSLGIVLSMLAVGWLSREVIRPLCELKDRVESLMQGRDVRLAVSRQDEVGQLARAFERLLEDRRNAEREALRGQKLQQLGMLAGGIAHDFNNLLQSIACNAFLLRSEMGDDHPCSSRVMDIEAATEKGARFSKELLQLSREHPTQSKVVDLTDIAREAMHTAGPLLGDKIRCDPTFSPEPLPIFANAIQIEQVILNLIVNARDAMPAGGYLRVETGKDEGGQYAFARVTDSGDGISEDLQTQIFEPFFTTKSEGRGTGLGLAIVSDVVRKMRGRVDVDSEPGTGSTFTVRLPLFSEPPNTPNEGALRRLHV